MIRTDHSALQSLRKTPEHIGTQACWQAFIEQFNFKIQHRPGTRHLNADALSRKPIIEAEKEEGGIRMMRTVTFLDPQKSGRQEQVSAGESMTALQLQDSDIGPLLRLRLQQTNQPRPEEVLTESEAVMILRKDGVLYRRLYTKNGRPPSLQLVVQHKDGPN